MKVYSQRVRFRTDKYGFGLADTINQIGYENILQILPCYDGGNECFYTIIYKTENRSDNNAE